MKIFSPISSPATCCFLQYHTFWYSRSWDKHCVFAEHVWAEFSVCWLKPMLHGETFSWNCNVRQCALTVLLLLDVVDDEVEEPVVHKRDCITWVRAWIGRRATRGVYHQLMKELEDKVAYRNFFCMNGQKFRFSVDSVGYAIAKKDMLMRESIEPDERVAVTLRYLATGETFKSLEYAFRISPTCISSIVVETCEAIFAILGPIFCKTPTSKQEWISVAKHFEDRWNFPNGVGEIDGKRILIRQPHNASSHYHDYKGHNSLILMAVFGGDYECLWADVGANGHASDGGVWHRSDLKRLLSSPCNLLCLPSPKPLPGRMTPVPYVLTGGDAFSLTKYLMKPYPHSNLNNEQRILDAMLTLVTLTRDDGQDDVASSHWFVYWSTAKKFHEWVLHGAMHPSFLLTPLHE